MAFDEAKTVNPHVNGKVVGFYRDFVVLKMEAGSGKVGVTKAMLKSWGNDM